MSDLYPPAPLPEFLEDRPSLFRRGINALGGLVSTPYRGVETAIDLGAGALEGDPLGRFRLTPEGRDASALDDIGGTLGLTAPSVSQPTPYQLAKGGIAAAARRMAGYQDAPPLDADQEAGFRQAHPWAAGSEAAADVLGELGTQAALDPVMHGMGTLAGRRAAGQLAAEATQAVGAGAAEWLPGAAERAAAAEATGRRAAIGERALGAAFIPGMAMGAVEHLTSLPQIIQQHGAGSPEAITAALQGAGEVAFSVMGGHHALSGGFRVRPGVFDDPIPVQPPAEAQPGAEAQQPWAPPPDAGQPDLSGPAQPFSLPADQPFQVGPTQTFDPNAPPAPPTPEGVYPGEAQPLPNLTGPVDIPAERAFLRPDLAEAGTAAEQARRTREFLAQQRANSFEGALQDATNIVPAGPRLSDKLPPLGEGIRASQAAAEAARQQGVEPGAAAPTTDLDAREAASLAGTVRSTKAPRIQGLPDAELAARLRTYQRLGLRLSEDAVMDEMARRNPPTVPELAATDGSSTAVAPEPAEDGGAAPAPATPPPGVFDQLSPREQAALATAGIRSPRDVNNRFASAEEARAFVEPLLNRKAAPPPSAPRIDQGRTVKEMEAIRPKLQTFTDEELQSRLKGYRRMKMPGAEDLIAQEIERRASAGEARPERRLDADLRARWSELDPDQQYQAAYTDPLMKIPNRRAFEELHPADQNDAPAPIPGAHYAEMDLAGLGGINEKLGKSTADEALAQFGRALADHDIEAYRTGGDEITTVFRGGKAEADIKLPALRDTLAKAILEVRQPDGTTKYYKNAIQTYVGEGASPHEASRAVYSAKEAASRSGRRNAKGSLPRGLSEYVPEGDQGQPHPAAEELAAPPAAPEPEARATARTGLTEKTPAGEQRIIPGALELGMAQPHRTEGREADGPLFTAEAEKKAQAEEDAAKAAQRPLQLNANAGGSDTTGPSHPPVTVRHPQSKRGLNISDLGRDDSPPAVHAAFLKDKALGPLMDELAGISADVTRLGRHGDAVRFKGLTPAAGVYGVYEEGSGDYYLNPLTHVRDIADVVMERDRPEQFNRLMAKGLWKTMLHEITHDLVKEHGESHIDGVVALRKRIGRAGTELVKRLEAMVARHRDALADLYDQHGEHYAGKGEDGSSGEGGGDPGVRGPGRFGASTERPVRLGEDQAVPEGRAARGAGLAQYLRDGARGPRVEVDPGSSRGPGRPGQLEAAAPLPPQRPIRPIPPTAKPGLRLVAEGTPPPLDERPNHVATGNPPRVEAKEADLRAGGDTASLSRDKTQTWDSLDPKIRTIQRTVSDEQLYRRVATKAPDAADVQALDARVKAKKDTFLQAQQALTAARQAGSGVGEANAHALQAALDVATADYVQAGRKDVEFATNLGRALAARARIMKAGGIVGDDVMRQIMRQLPEVNEKQAGELLQVFHQRPGDFPDAVRAAMKPKALSKWLEAWKAGLVSGPGTQVANILGNIGEQSARLAETVFSAGMDRAISAFHGGERTRYQGEAGLELHGAASRLGEAFGQLTKDLKDAFTLAPEDFKTSERWEGQIGAIPGKTGRAVRIPFRLLEAADNFFKAVGGDAEMGKLAYRQAYREIPGARPQQLTARAKEIVAEAQAGKHPELLAKVEQAKRARTFQDDPGQLAESLMDLRNKNRWMNVVLPFLRTPANILKVSLQRSPVGFLGGLKAYREYLSGERSMRAGDPAFTAERVADLRGAATDKLGRAALGTAILGVFAAYAKGGGMTGSGPTDAKERNLLRSAGWQPYSFTFTGKDGRRVYVPFNRLEPVSSMLGFAADLAEMKDQRKAGDLFDKALGSIAQNLTNKTYLQGLSDAASAYHDPKQFMSQYVTGLAGTVVPSIVAKAAVALDPTVRVTKGDTPGLAGIPQTITRTIESRIPGLSSRLEAKPGATGEDSERPGNAVSRFLLPSQVSGDKEGHELESELARIGYAPSVPPKQITVRGPQGQPIKVPLTDEEYAHMEAAQRRAADFARRVIQSPSYQNMPDTVEEGGQRSKEAIIRRYFERERAQATSALQPVVSRRQRAGASL